MPISAPTTITIRTLHRQAPTPKRALAPPHQTCVAGSGYLSSACDIWNHQYQAARPPGFRTRLGQLRYKLFLGLLPSK